MNTNPQTDTRTVVDQPWAKDVAELLAALSVDPQRGLSSEQIPQLRARFGPNQLRTAAPRDWWVILADQFRNVVVLLLATAGTLAVVFGEYIEGLAIFAVILINSAIGFVTEWRATRSMEALRRLGHVDTVVVRDGATVKVSADELLPGDIVVLEGGDIVTADIRLVEAAKLQADESALTGESLPVSKSKEPLAGDTALMDRSNMLFKGTALTRGSGRGVVVGVGQHTELGRISSLVTTAESQQTPLEKRLDALGERLAWGVIVLAVLIAVAGILAGRSLFLAIEVAIALAVAAIPEGLPIVATIALARGMWRMARRSAVISRLSAVETLGATSVILTDKTGTLTENRMVVVEAWLPDAQFRRDATGLVATGAECHSETSGQAINRVLEIAALCTNASVKADSGGKMAGVGDPTEVALLAAALERGIERERLVEKFPEVAEVAFDPELKLMATLHIDSESVLFAVKGAPEAVLPRCEKFRTSEGDRPLDGPTREEWLEHAREFGNRGLRTLAVACKKGATENEDAYCDLVLLGLLGLEDPPRAGVDLAIQRCRDAGIDVIMVTGDHAATACNIAAQIGIASAGGEAQDCVDGAELDAWLARQKSEKPEKVAVFSRVSPEQKLRLIDLYQNAGNVVAMTGDGVNDAPALKKSDIGVAMGIRGTAVAREAAHMVLRDDEFGTIAEAVAQGRAIYQNIRKFAVYLLSCNISEVLVVTLATIAGAPLPLLPLQILFLNLVTDVFPALALGVGEGAPGLMKRPPRPAAEPLLTRQHWTRIGLHGVVISTTVLTAMAIAVFQLGFDAAKAVTVSFCTLAFAQLWHVINMRDRAAGALKNEITRNPWVWGAMILCTGLVLGAIYTPLLGEVLALENPGAAGWSLILPMSLVPVIIGPLVGRFTQPVSTRS